MNVSKVLEMDYENKHNWTLGENEPKTNPIQTQSNPIYEMTKMNVNKVLTKDYGNVHLYRRGKNKPNSNPISSPAKPEIQYCVFN
jgi:hypothetical protein